MFVAITPRREYSADLGDFDGPERSIDHRDLESPEAVGLGPVRYQDVQGVQLDQPAAKPRPFSSRPSRRDLVFKGQSSVGRCAIGVDDCSGTRSLEEVWTDTGDHDPMSYSAAWSSDRWLAALERHLWDEGAYLIAARTRGLRPLNTGKIPRDLTPEEISANLSVFPAAKAMELRGRFELNRLVRHRRAQCRNIIDSRWAITWAMVDGVLAIKCRLAARGVKRSAARSGYLFWQHEPRWAAHCQRHCGRSL